MNRAFRLALAFAGILMAVTGASSSASQAGRMDHAARMNDFEPYSAGSVTAAMADGKTVLLFFHAPWCPVCKAQEPKVRAQLNGAHKDVVAFRVDYDSNTALRKQLAVDKQSTLILYHGTKEVARLSYKSDDQSIAEFFSHAPTMQGGK